MATYLTQEWLDLEREVTQALPEHPGASARIQHVVTGGPDGDVKYSTVVEDGRIVESALGTDDDAEVTLTTTYANAVSILRGELDPNAAFMQGRTKVTGDMGRLLSLLPLAQTDDRRAARARLAEATAFGP